MSDVCGPKPGFAIVQFTQKILPDFMEHVCNLGIVIFQNERNDNEDFKIGLQIQLLKLPLPSTYVFQNSFMPHMSRAPVFVWVSSILC